MTPVTCRMNAGIVLPGGAVLGARVALAWEPTDPLAVHLRLEAPRPCGGCAAYTRTVARQFLGDLFRDGEVDPGGDLSAVRTENTGCLTLRTGDRSTQVFFPLVELARFLAATEKACPAGSIAERGAVVADLNRNLAALA